jgi:hypothetical protein
MSRQRRFRIKREGLNVHHIRASSRGGGSRDNLVVLPIEWHANWHKLFVNMTLEEVHRFINVVMQPGYEWNYKSLDQLRRQIMGG